MSRNTKTNSELELDGNNGYGTCQDPLTCMPIHSTGWLQISYILGFHVTSEKTKIKNFKF